MPIAGRIISGTRVRVRGQEYLVRPNGTATYLYADEAGHAAKQHVGTIATYVLRRDGARVGRRARVAADDIRYVYVVRDMDAPHEHRALKIGITSSIDRTLRTYRRLEPNAQAIVVVDVGASARPLERALLAEFAVHRVDNSEVVHVRPHEVRRALRAMHYRQADDGIWRRE